jgi:glutamate racemase
MRIGVFDSGVGGITVLKELRERFPAHEYLYFGDTANVPYGTKSPRQIQILAKDAALHMKTKGIEALVIACNTAASLALDEFMTVLAPIPVLDVVDAGVRAVLAEQKNAQSVLILGTRATIRSRIYSKRLGDAMPSLQVYEQECPLVVPMIEEGWSEHPVLSMTIHEYVKEYQGVDPGVALLACTHYPWAKKAFEASLPGWRVVNSAPMFSEIAEERLALSRATKDAVVAPIQWNFSDPDAVPRAILTEMLGMVPSHPDSPQFLGRF